MPTPAAGEFVISQGDSLPIMRIPIPANSAGELINLSGCDVTFLGRPANTRPLPPPVVRPIQSYAEETHDFGDGAVAVIAVYVHLTTTDTKAVTVPTKDDYAEMEGELEIVDASGDVLTIPTLAYIKWWIRDDIGDGA